VQKPCHDAPHVAKTALARFWRVQGTFASPKEELLACSRVKLLLPRRLYVRGSHHQGINRRRRRRISLGALARVCCPIIQPSRPLQPKNGSRERQKVMRRRAAQPEKGACDRVRQLERGRVKHDSRHWRPRRTEGRAERCGTAADRCLPLPHAAVGAIARERAAEHGRHVHADLVCAAW
jgi:hypothetical protein